jgi:hypothetical protein
MAAAPPIPADAGEPEQAPPSPQPQGWVPPTPIPSAPTNADPGRDTLARLIDAQNARQDDPYNTQLRNQEHELFSQHVIDTYGPFLGRAIVTAAVPGYAAAKAAAQALPEPIGQAIDKVSPFKLAGATKPDLGEVQAGLKPVFQLHPLERLAKNLGL